MPRSKKTNRGDGRYELKNTIGHDANGKPIRKSFYGKNKDEAQVLYEGYRRGEETSKILCLLLAIILCFALCSSCGGSTDDNDYAYEEGYEDEYDDFESQTVYVSKSGKKIHSMPNCSGMKYYNTMTLETALNRGYDLCSNCW